MCNSTMVAILGPFDGESLELLATISLSAVRVGKWAVCRWSEQTQTFK